MSSDNKGTDLTIKGLKEAFEFLMLHSNLESERFNRPQHLIIKDRQFKMFQGYCYLLEDVDKNSWRLLSIQEWKEFFTPPLFDVFKPVK